MRVLRVLLIDACRLKALDIPHCVVIVSLYDAAEHAAEACAAGADAFISKHHFGEQALSVISALFALEQVEKQFNH